MSSKATLNCFAKWDTDNSGFISKAELKTVLVAVGVPEENVDNIFADADTNRDGYLDYTEFVGWLWGSAPAEIKEELEATFSDGEGKFRTSSSIMQSTMEWQVVDSRSAEALPDQRQASSEKYNLQVQKASTTLRLLVTEKRTPGGDNQWDKGVQLSCINLYDSEGIRIDIVDARSPCGRPFSGWESPEKAVDGNLDTKWGDFSFADNGYSELVLTLREAACVASYDIWTANDGPCRDPASWTLEVGSVAFGKEICFETQLGEDWGVTFGVPDTRLEVISATYGGRFPDHDVTQRARVVAAASNGFLTLNPVFDDITGLGDPEPGDRKKLKITYVLHEDLTEETMAGLEQVTGGSQAEELAAKGVWVRSGGWAVVWCGATSGDADGICLASEGEARATFADKQGGGDHCMLLGRHAGYGCVLARYQMPDLEEKWISVLDKRIQEWYYRAWDMDDSSEPSMLDGEFKVIRSKVFDNSIWEGDCVAFCTGDSLFLDTGTLSVRPEEDIAEASDLYITCHGMKNRTCSENLIVETEDGSVSLLTYPQKQKIIPDPAVGGLKLCKTSEGSVMAMIWNKESQECESVEIPQSSSLAFIKSGEDAVKLSVIMRGENSIYPAAVFGADGEILEYYRGPEGWWGSAGWWADHFMAAMRAYLAFQGESNAVPYVLVWVLDNEVTREGYVAVGGQGCATEEDARAALTACTQTSFFQVDDEGRLRVANSEADATCFKVQRFVERPANKFHGQNLLGFHTVDWYAVLQAEFSEEGLPKQDTETERGCLLSDGEGALQHTRLVGQEAMIEWITEFYRSKGNPNNVGGYTSDCIPDIEDCIKSVKFYGNNVVRVPTKLDMWLQPGEGFSEDQEFMIPVYNAILPFLDRFFDACDKYSVGVILGNFGEIDFFRDEYVTSEEWVRANTLCYQHMCERYRERRSLVGIDLVNEGYGADGPQKYRKTWFHPAHDNKHDDVVDGYYQAGYDTIRKYGNRKIIVQISDGYWWERIIHNDFQAPRYPRLTPDTGSILIDVHVYVTKFAGECETFEELIHVTLQEYTRLNGAVAKHYMVAVQETGNWFFEGKCQDLVGRWEDQEFAELVRRDVTRMLGIILNRNSDGGMVWTWKGWKSQIQEEERKRSCRSKHEIFLGLGDLDSYEYLTCDPYDGKKRNYRSEGLVPVMWASVPPSE